ncbi:MAG: Mur ligase family protein [bacterium]
MNIDLQKIKKVYFIGIGGIGISALAKWARAKGMEVSGVNDEEGKTIDSLKEVGINVMSKTVFDILPEADMYVYSDAWPYRGPEIIEAAKNTGKPTLSYFEALGVFAKDYKVIAVAGTHGKTTTTAMIADVLIDGGIDPTVIVGSFVKKFNSNFRQGGSEYLVVEADEFNRHFLNFHPEITVITNIEADHFETYKDIGDIEDTFRKLVEQTGKAVIFNSNDVSASDVVMGVDIKVADYLDSVNLIPKLLTPGEHNRKNAACALLVAKILDIDIEKAKETLANFQGTWRRLEKRGVTEAGTIIYDDYAHHPTEVQASILGLRELYPAGSKKITIVFQPHLYTRTKALFADFAKCFHGADKVVLLPIYFAREAIDESISSGKLAEAVCENGDKAIAFTDFELAEAYLAGGTFGKDDIFVTMGAGEAYKIADKLFKFK